MHHPTALAASAVLLATLAVSLALLAVVTGCEEKKPAPARNPAPPTGILPGDQPGADAQGTLKAAKDKAISAADSALEATHAKIETLKQKAAQLAPDARAAFDDTVRVIDDRYAALRAQLGELRTTEGAEAWRKLSTDITAAIGKLNESIRSAMDKYAK